MTAESASQHLAEMFDDAHSTLAIVVTNENGDRVQCVEKKMRVELRLKCRKARAGELFGKSCDLHFALTRLDEITGCVFDPDYAEINGNTKRQCSKDPTHPFDSHFAPEVWSLKEFRSE